MQLVGAGWGGWRAGDQPGSSAGSWCPSGWGNCLLLLSCFSPRGPPTCISCSSLGLLPMPPRTYMNWRGLWVAGDWPGRSAGSPDPSEQGNRPPLLSCSSWMAPPTCPQDPHGLDGALDGREAAWELSRLPCPSGPGDLPLLLSGSFQRVPPTCLF